MLVVITKVNMKTSPENLINDVVAWCTMCAERDKTFSFKYDPETKRLQIESPTWNQAYKRGSALHTRFKVFYNVEKKDEEA
jgi:hypothetical protein